MAFHCSLSESKSPHVSQILLSILADLNAVIWMFFTRPLFSKSSTSFTNPLVIVPKAPITISVTVTLIFFSSLVRSWYLSFFSLSFSFTLWSARTAKSTIRMVFFFLFFLFGWLSLSQTWSIKWNAVSSKLRSYWYCYMDALPGR